MSSPRLQTTTKLVAFSLLLGLLPACALLSQGKDRGEHADTGKVDKKTDAGEEGVAAAPPAAAVSPLTDEQELKLAKLWARVDELEEEQYRQKERLQVVEKGLTLGLVPEELKHAEKGRSGAGSRSEPEAEAAAPKNARHAKGKAGRGSKGRKEGQGRGEGPEQDHREEGGSVSAAGEEGERAGHGNETATESAKEKPERAHDAEGKDDAEDKPDSANSAAYQKALAAAHDQYREGRYGRAIVEYSEIGKTFGDATGSAMHLYWIAKCWENLKEYNTAKQQFEDFLGKHPNSPWAPRAKFDLGKVDWQLGLQQSALKIFRDLIQEHPYEDAAEMAKMELDTLDKKL